MRRLPRLFMWTVVAGLVTFGVLSMMAPRYQSEAQITVSAKGASKLDPRRDGQSPEAVAVRMDKEVVNTHVRALQSRDLALQIAQDLKLQDRVEFNSALGTQDKISALLRMAGIGAPRANETDEDRTLRAFYDRLEVYPARDSRVIGIRFTSSNPELAAEAANDLVDHYRTLLAYRSVAETDEVQKALIPKIESLKRETAEAEKAVEKLRGEANIFKGGQQSTGLNEQQLAELTAELSKAQVARSEAEARKNSAREMLTSGSADALPDVQRSPLIQNLVQQRVRAERQISELSATLLPGHPRMRQLNADLSGLKRQIRGEISKVVQSLDKEAKVAKLREESIQRSLAEIKARIVKASPDEVKLRQLENDAKTKRAELVRLQAQFEANRLSDDSRAVPVEVQVITRASPSSVPVFPKKVPLSALIMTAVFLFGLVGTITRGLLAGARHSARGQPHVRMTTHEPPQNIHVEPSLAPQPVPMAAGIPESSVSGIAMSDVPIPEAEMPQPTVLRMSISEIASKILLKPAGSMGVRTLVTSDAEDLETAEEGLALANALAAMDHSVILIDWSFKGDGLGHHLGITSPAGLTGLFDGTAKFQDVVTCAPGGSVHVIPSGKALAIDSSGIDADHINLVLDALDETYDQIVVMGRHAEAKSLFEVIEGRFDAVMIVRDEQHQLPTHGESPNTVLGFEVTDIDIFRYIRAASKAPLGGVPLQRFQKFAGKVPRLQVAAVR